MTEKPRKKKEQGTEKVQDDSREELKKKLQQRSKEIAAGIQSPEETAQRVEARSQEIAAQLKKQETPEKKPEKEKVEIKDIAQVEKELAKEAAPPEPKREKPKKTKAAVKSIETVEREIAKAVEKQKPPEPPKIYSFPEGIRVLREQAKKRKFSQSVDLVISLRGMDLKRPENRLNLEYTLPAGRGKELSVGVFADSLAAEAKAKGADVVIEKGEIAGLAKNKKKLKAVAKQVDWFYGEVTLMAEIGKSLGAVLGPRGKVPKPLPPKVDVGLFIKKARRTVKIVVKETPVLAVGIGNEAMTDEDLLKNLEGVVGFVRERLPKGINNVRSLNVKLTMGPPVRLEVK